MDIVKISQKEFFRQVESVEMAQVGCVYCKTLEQVLEKVETCEPVYNGSHLVSGKMAVKCNSYQVVFQFKEDGSESHLGMKSARCHKVTSQHGEFFVLTYSDGLILIYAINNKL